MRGCPYFREQVGTSQFPFPLMRKVEGFFPIVGMEHVADTIWKEYWGPRGRGSKKIMGAPGDWGIKQLRRWLKLRAASGTSFSSRCVCLGSGSRVSHLLLSH